MKNILIISILFLSAGCSLEATLDDLTEVVDNIFPAKATGLVAGSTQVGTATGPGGTYKIQSTIGNYVSGIEQSTSDGKYKVSSSVQGAMVSK